MFSGQFVVGDRNFSQLDIALSAPAHNFKLLHHLLIARYAKITMHHSDKPLQLTGLDIETDHTTGEPRLLGYSLPDGSYWYDDTPTLSSFFNMISRIIDNAPGSHLVTWGSLDIACIIRLFGPSENERKKISRGLAGRFHDGAWIAQPPLMRNMYGTPFYIDQYIAGRSLRIGVQLGSRTRSIWVYNLSQFFQSTIASTAKALGLDWTDYNRETHLIDWTRFHNDESYGADVIASNRQDAVTVQSMATHLGEVFNRVFGAYPSLLVSAGSLTDAAVSKLLSLDEYASNSWRYLTATTFKDSAFIEHAENLLSEAFSAGYVDQFAIGYFPEVHTADISSAYPHKIRQLPDLRNAVMYAGNGDPSERIRRLQSEGMEFFTAVIRGVVTIPEHLKYHPITIRTSQRQNIRPLGTFRAAYLWDEREFCIEWGARFSNEEWVIFAVKEWREAPIARVSSKLAQLRNQYRTKMSLAATQDERVLYDSMQYMIKVVDNSLYGKNVMTTQIVEDIDGKPVITGYKAGDRFNLLYGCVITARTRIQLANACMELEQAGSRPILAMTDSIYWTGKAAHLPESVVARKEKTAGMFEPPESVKDFYLVKTGQYEYRQNGSFHHKMRGLNLPFENRDSSESFYRDTIKEWAADKSPYLHPEDIEIPIPTRKLVTVGSMRLENLGLVADGESLMRPFVLSGKQVERYVLNWRDALDGAVWLAPVVADGSTDRESPLEMLSGLNINGGNYITRHERKRIFYYTVFKVNGRFKLPKRRLSDMNWTELEEWSGIKREWVGV